MASLGTLVLDTTRSDDPINSNLTNDPNPGAQTQVANFLTVQSLTFAVASFAVGAVWDVLQKSFPGVPVFREAYFPLIIGAIIVLAGWFNSYGDLANWWKRLSALLIGVINTFLLAAGALGVSLAIPD